jgi:hypothetical protein
MTSSRKRTLVGALVTAAALLASWLVFTTLYSGPSCSSERCTFYDHGKASPGRCGAVKGDNSRCYCIQIIHTDSAADIVGPAPPEPQATCTVK